MPRKNKPPVDCFLTSEIYNTLMHTLENFGENFTDEAWISKRANALKRQIENYARVRNERGDEVASVFLFENEAADLIVLLLFALYGTTPQDSKFYDRLKAKFLEKKSRKTPANLNENFRGGG